MSAADVTALITALAGVIGAVTALITAIRGNAKARVAVSAAARAHQRLSEAGIPPAGPPPEVPETRSGP